MKGLFDYLDVEFSKKICGHDMSITKEYSDTKCIEFEKLQKWCNEHGCYCDCEILNNCEQHIDETLRKTDGTQFNK